MSRVHTPRFIVLGAVVVILAANAVLFGGRLLSWIGDGTADGIAAMSGALNRARALISVAFRRTDLAAQVSDLERENERLRSELSQAEQLRRDIEFYRSAAGISPRPASQPIEAALFSYGSIVGVWQAILNRGSADGIAPGDVIVSAQGALVGVVRSVSARHASVVRVHDLTFEVTARVEGSEVSGLVRSDGDGSVRMDLVQKDESVAEGMRIITSGDDRYPAGLFIGTVRSVDNTAPTLFQIVRIAPAVPDAFSGPVLIIRP